MAEDTRSLESFLETWSWKDDRTLFKITEFLRPIWHKAARELEKECQQAARLDVSVYESAGFIYAFSDVLPNFPVDAATFRNYCVSIARAVKTLKDQGGDDVKAAEKLERIVFVPVYRASWRNWLDGQINIDAKPEGKGLVIYIYPVRREWGQEERSYDPMPEDFEAWVVEALRGCE